MEVTGEAQQQGGKPCDTRSIESQETFVIYLCQDCSVFFDEKGDTRKEENTHTRKEENTHALQKVGRENFLEAYHALDFTSRDRLTTRGSFPEFISIRHQSSTKSKYYSDDSMETTPLLPTRSVTISVDEDTYHDRSIASKTILSDASEVVVEKEVIFQKNLLGSDSSTEKPYEETSMVVRVCMAVRVFRQLQQVFSKQKGSVVKKNPGATEPKMMSRTWRLLRVSNAAKNFCEGIRRKWNTAKPINDGEKAKRNASNKKSLKNGKRRNHSRRHREAAVQRLKAMIEHMHSQSHADRDYHDKQQEKKDSFACSMHDNIDQILHQEVHECMECMHKKEGAYEIEPTNERSSFHSGHRDNALLPIAPSSSEEDVSFAKPDESQPSNERIPFHSDHRDDALLPIANLSSEQGVSFATDTPHRQSSIDELGAVLNEYFDQCNVACSRCMHEKEGAHEIEPTNERSSFHSGHHDNALLPIATLSSEEGVSFAKPDEIEPINVRITFHSDHRDNALLPISNLSSKQGVSIATDASHRQSSIDELGAVPDENFDQCNAPDLKDLKSMAPEGSRSTSARELHELLASLSYYGSTECSSGDSSIDCSDLVEHEDNTVEKFGYYQHEFECFEHVVYQA
jgi:hypothetical protein